MIIVALRVFAFLVVFAIEVRVRAEPALLKLANALFEQPEDCWKNGSGNCAVKTKAGERAVLKMASIEGPVFSLDQGTTFMRVGEQFRLVAGTVWIKSAEEILVRAEFGEIRIKGEAWVSRDQDRILVTAIAGTIKMNGRGSTESLELPPGFENWLGRVDASGLARAGLPVAIQLQPHLARWARLFDGGRKDFESEARHFHEVWAEATREAALLHKTLHARKMASIESDHQRNERSRRAIELENQKLREMFRRKVLSNE